MGTGNENQSFRSVQSRKDPLRMCWRRIPILRAMYEQDRNPYASGRVHNIDGIYLELPRSSAT